MAERTSPRSRHEQNRKQQRGSQRAQVVERQHVRDDVAEVVALAHHAHQQRNLEPDQHADDHHERVHQQLESLRVGEGQEKQRRRESADHAQHQLDPHEAVGQPAMDVARERAANPHRKQIAADDGRELQDAVAEQVAGERARDQLVDEPAGRDEQDRDEQQDSHEFSEPRPR